MFCSRLLTILTCMSLLGCGADKDTAEEISYHVTLPQAGDWSVITTGYTNDDCNAEGFLIPFDTVTVADVAESSFSITYYLENVRIGETSDSCTHIVDDEFDCSDVNHSTPFSDTATINMVASGTISVGSDTSILGAGNLVLDCIGMGCDQVVGMTNTGSLPCDTTLNWSATAD
jgi:hypothetical protein